jgi:hypothetical protein
VEQELLTLPQHLRSSPIFNGVCFTRSVLSYVMLCRSLFILFLLAIVLSVLRYTSSDYYRPTEWENLVVMNYSWVTINHCDLYRLTVVQPIKSSTQFLIRKELYCKLKWLDDKVFSLSWSMCDEWSVFGTWSVVSYRHCHILYHIVILEYVCDQ